MKVYRVDELKFFFEEAPGGVDFGTGEEFFDFWEGEQVDVVPAVLVGGGVGVGFFGGGHFYLAVVEKS